MRKFSDMEKEYQLKMFLDSSRGYMYVYKPPLQEKMVIRHLNGELKPGFAQFFAEIVEKINQWITTNKLLNRYVKVELVREVGEDFIVLPHHKNYSSLSVYEDLEEEFKPKEIEIMQSILKNEIGNPENEKEKIIEEILVRSLIEPSGKTWYDDKTKKFIISEPRITQEHLEKWKNISNEHG